MSDLPKSVTLVEEGPREGFQIEKTRVSTKDKVLLIDALSGTGLRHIEVTSFVSPKVVPQMADAAAVAASFVRKPGVRYSALTMTAGAVRQVQAAGKFDDAGPLLIIASDAVSKSNMNKTTSEAMGSAAPWLEAVKEAGFPFDIVVANAFGCNVEGDIPPARIISIIEAMVSLGTRLDLNIRSVGLADTVGAANPVQVKRLVSMVRDRLPELEVYLHLHDTRGTGMANVYAGLEVGVARFDCSIGGLGGCPYAAGAAGNVATEDLALLCEEMGIRTGLNMEKLFDCARLAEKIVGHSLPGKAKCGGVVRH